VEQLYASLTSELEEINEVFRHPAKLQMSREDHQAFDNAEVCHICGGDFGPDMVESHCPSTGLYHGAAHKHCEWIKRYPSHMEKNDWTAFDRATSCELCRKPFEDDDKTKLFDNTGVYRGAYHRTCKPKRSPQQRLKLYEAQNLNIMQQLYAASVANHLVWTKFETIVISQVIIAGLLTAAVTSSCVSALIRLKYQWYSII
jgi:hypothetical protein